MTQTLAQRRIGAHVSAAGGVHLAVERAAAIGCNCVQVFSGSPRVWQKPKLETIDVKKIRTNQDKYNVQPIFTHALYLVNLASDNPDLVKKSIASLRYELQFDGQISGAGVIVHVGSHQGRGFAQTLKQVVENIAQVLDTTPAQSTLLIENAAAHNGKVGGTLAEIAQLLEGLEAHGGFVSQGRLGWCFDTCHAFAAGVALPTAVAQMKELAMLSSLRCIHVNDSRDPFDSGRDRHENLGDGTIPREQLRAFLTQAELRALPLILEVPGLDKKGPDAENVARLKRLVGV